jgi:hypothetical protein
MILSRFADQPRKQNWTGILVETGGPAAGTAQQLPEGHEVMFSRGAESGGAG